jgi:hypothetical protein
MATTKTETARVTLPGRMFRKAGRWWWNVQLPGEDRCRARALRAPEDRTATSDRRIAEEAAIRLWQDALRCEAQAEIRAELRTQSEQKSRAYQFLIDQMTEVPRLSYRQAPWTAPSTFQVQVVSDTDSTVSKPIEKLTCRQAPPQSRVACLRDPRPEVDTSFDLMDILSRGSTAQERQGCECCGSKDFFDEYLQTVENGQQLCPRCVQAMRDDTFVVPGDVIML